MFDIIDSMSGLNTMDDMREDIKKVFVDKLFVERKKEIEDALERTKKNNEKTEE